MKVRSALDGAIKPFIDHAVIPGAVVAIITKQGTQFLSYGRISKANARMPNRKTQFGIASVSKVFTTVALANLVGEGKIAMQEPAETYLPAGTRLPTRGGKKIKIVHLATHTSGYPAGGSQDDTAHLGWFSPGLWKIAFKHVVIHRRKTRLAGITWDDLLYVYSGYPLPQPPGEKWNYSSIGMGMLGHIMARVDGRAYEDIIQARICEPLGLKHTGITPPGKSSKPVMYMDLGPIAPAGGLYSNVEDLAVFVNAAMGKQETSLASAFALSFKIHHRDKEKKPYALGWGTNRMKNWYYHQGGTHAFVAFNPARKHGVVILCTSGGMNLKIVDLAFATMDLLEGRTPAFPKPQIAVDLPPEVLARCAGTYTPKKGNALKVTHEGKALVVHFKKGGPTTLWPESETGFFCKEWDCHVVFKIDKSGAVTGATVKMYNWTGVYEKTR